MTQFLTIAALCGVILIWGYFFARGLRRKEFRRKGYWGWFKKDDEPLQFWLYVGVCLVELAACAFVLISLIGRP